MMKSLYSGVTGMKTHNQRMDVIGNNISNVNTTGYKASEVTFKDVYYQTKSGASAGNATEGGKNPTQVGYGVQLGTISQIMSQSGFTNSDSVFNCALEGEGFFQVMNEAGNIYYTRAGKFSVDSYGNLCDPNGNVVLGVSGDPTGVEDGQSQRINIRVPAVDNNNASQTKVVNGYEITISAGTFGEDGNISFTIVDSDTPYATKTGTNLTIYMDLSQEFGKEALDAVAAMTDPTDTDKRQAVEAALADFKSALNDAIVQGGVGLPEGIIPLQVEFETLPPYDQVIAKSATNQLNMSYDTTDAGGTVTTTPIGLQFTANVPGEYGNKYEIDLKYNSDLDAPTAKWKDSVLTITVPNNTTLAAIQAAVDAAADGEEKRMITVDYGVASTTTNPDGTVTETRYTAAQLEAYNFSNLKNNVERLGLDDGRDNFFSDIATGLSTVVLTDGRTAAEQAVDDLETIRIDSSGVIYGRHAVHGLLMLGRIDIATFENPVGLEQVGTSLWRESLASGEASVKIAGSDGAGKVVSSALEMSNVDLAQEFSDMIITQRGYQANSRVITVSDTMLEELVNLKR